MRIAQRIWIPALLALCLCGAIGVMFFLHIQTSIALIERTANVIHDKGVAMIRPLFERDEPIIGPMDAEALGDSHSA
jgi:hypothetical protein